MEGGQALLSSSFPPAGQLSSFASMGDNQAPAKKRGWKFDNPCLMCKKGTSKILGDAEVPCTCGGKPSKKRSITAEAFNPFALPSTAPSFVPPTKVTDVRKASSDNSTYINTSIPTPPMATPEHLPSSLQFVNLLPSTPQQPHLPPHQQFPTSSNQRPFSLSRPIPTAQTYAVPIRFPQQQMAPPTATMPAYPIPLAIPTPQLSQPVTHKQYPQHLPRSQPPSNWMQPAPQQAQSFSQQPLQLVDRPPQMDGILINILDEMKQLSTITQQLKDEHSGFLHQVARLKKRNHDMQVLIKDYGVEPLKAFSQVNGDEAHQILADLLPAAVPATAAPDSVISTVRSDRNSSLPPPVSYGTSAALQRQPKTSSPVPNALKSFEDCDAPFVITDATKPFVVMRLPLGGLSLTTYEITQICEQNKISKSAKDKLRMERLAVNESFCELLSFKQDELLQSKEPIKIIRSKHKKHFFLKLAPHLLRKSSVLVSSILPFEPRFRTKEGTILFTSARIQIFYSEMGAPNFFVVSIEAVQKTHVPRYLISKQKRTAKQQSRQRSYSDLGLQLAGGGHNPLSLAVEEGDSACKALLSSKKLEEEDDLYREDDEDGLDAEEEAFLDSGGYTFLCPQPDKRSKQTLADAPYASPVDSPASPQDGGSISVGTLREFETALAGESDAAAGEDYSWLLTQQPDDTFSLVL